MDLDVAIVGGGLTGLATAQAAARQGLAVAVIEGRTRLGGRILSAPWPTDAGPRFDLGPAWFWPGQRRMAALAARLGIGVFGQHSEGRTALETPDGRVRRDLRLALNGNGLRLSGGMAALIEGLAAELPEGSVWLGRAARRIAREAGGWRVETADGGETRARAVVVAAPPRIAGERIEIPALEPSARAALARIPTWMAPHAKAAALYDAPFWRELGLSGDAIGQRGPLAQIHDASPADGSVGALFGFVGAPAAARAAMGPGLEDAIRAQLGALFGPEAARPQALLLQDWSADPFTATAADLDAPAGHPPYGPIAALDAWGDAGLIFAGAELAPEDGGLLEGALASAEKAVGQIAAALGGEAVVETAR
ncbi:MAG: FAD-dependent oxidoreductase [Pseudomonadota bacterium]